MSIILPKVSIIVVSLNTKNDFLETIKSINNQTYKHFEIIVIDGKSNDGTENEIIKMSNIFSKFIIEKDNGIYDAMNKGIVLAKGEWIIFLNSGDIFFEKLTLEKIFNKKKSYKDVIFGNTVIKNKKYKYISIGKNFEQGTVVMPFCHQSSFIKSSLLKKNLFNLDFTISSDFNLFYKCYMQKKYFYRLNIPFTIVKSGGISDIKRQQVYNENISIMKTYNKKINTLKIYMLKFFQGFKDVLKLLLPQKLKHLILKIKYNKRII
jgi:glycosyltransferase involved in cell wall biosynthesis